MLGLLGVLLLASVALNWTGRWPGWQRALRVRPWPVLPPGMRKFVLVVHVASSVGTLGAVAAFLALSIAGLASSSAQTVRAAYIAMDLTASFIILPLIIASLASGLVQSLGTGWGLLRHYWVLAKLMLTLVVAVVLLLQMDGISYLAQVALERALPSDELLALRRSIRTHAAGGLIALLVPVALSICKPRGVTAYAWRKQHEEFL